MKLIEKVAANRVLMEHVNDKLPVFIAYKLMKLLKGFGRRREFLPQKDV